MARVVHFRFRLLAALLVFVLCAAPAVASAYDFEITARTEAYGYQVRRYDQTGLLFLNRQRVTQLLGLRIFNILDPGQQAYGPDGRRAPALLYVNLGLRFAADFGAFAEAPKPVSELFDNRFEILVGSLEGRNLFGFLDFSLGRQYDFELYDFFAYDGLRVRLNAPFHLFVESHVGLQVDRTRPFSLTVFETDGTSGDSADDEAPNAAYGIAIGIDDPGHFSLRLAYRGVASRAAAEVGQADERPSTWAMDQEILFAGASWVVPVFGTRVGGALRYNAITASFDEIQASVGQRISQGHRVDLEFLRSRPHFDGDSIFNVFALEPFHELAGRYSLRLARRLLLEARVGYRWLWLADDESGDPGSLSIATTAAWRGERIYGAADFFWLDGRAGRRFGGELTGRWLSSRWFFGRRIGLEGRVSLAHYQDGERPEVAAITTFGFAAGALLQFLPGVRMHLSLEDNINRLYDSALRLFLAVDMEFRP